MFVFANLRGNIFGITSDDRRERINYSGLELGGHLLMVSLGCPVGRAACSALKIWFAGSDQFRNLWIGFEGRSPI